MRDDVTFTLAVLGAALGAWNFWKSNWGATPPYGVRIEHLEAARFAIRSTGRRRIVITRVRLSPSGGTDLPEMFSLSRGEAQHFTLRLGPGETEYPLNARVGFEQHQMALRGDLTVEFPFILVAQEAAQWKPQPPWPS